MILWNLRNLWFYEIYKIHDIRKIYEIYEVDKIFEISKIHEIFVQKIRFKDCGTSKQIFLPIFIER